MSIVTWNEKLGKAECPYLTRWAIKLPFGLTLRVHHWDRSDDKRAMHDHSWWFFTLVLKGRYEDWTRGPICSKCNGVGKLFTRPVEYHDWTVCDQCEGRGFDRAIQLMKPGSFQFRPALHTHTVNVQKGGCWTILLMGPETRKWGFWVRKRSGKWKWKKSNKYFLEHGHHPCDQL